jgi:hypothetical protein
MLKELSFRAVCVALVASAAFTTTGCVSKPTMRLHHAEVSGVALGFPPSASVLMTAVIDVYNPNGYDVAIRGVRGVVVFANRYTMPVNFQAQGDGLWLLAERTTQIRVPTPVPLDLALTLARETFNQPVVPFRITGKADVTATRTFKLERDDYSIDERGTFARQQLEFALPHF